MLPVLCFGDICADLLIPYGQAVSKLNPLETPTVAFSHGGSVANTAVALARLHTPVMFLGTAGQDYFGRQLKQQLIAEGVDASLLSLREDCMTTMVLLVLDEHGERVPFAYPAQGASQHQITLNQLPDDILDRIGWMHSSGMTLREEPAASTQLYLMQRCKERGIPVSLDINARLESDGNETFASNLKSALAYCDILFGSEQSEICALAGTSNPDEAARLLQKHVPIVVMRRGEKGAVVYDRDAKHSCDGFTVQVVDRVGAGDVYDGTFLSAIQSNTAIEEANALACAAGAWCVNRRGGRSGPWKKELEDFFKRGSQGSESDI